MRCACVDIGTNTTRLLVAERADAGFREVLSMRRFLRLSPGADGEIDGETVAALAEVVAAHVRVARDHGVQRPHVVATAAIRDAPNRDALCRAVHGATGLEVSVLRAEEEAALAFAGATASLHGHAPDGLIGVVDVGGGSSELVTGTARDGVGWWTSFPLGSGVLCERHLRSDPPTSAELDALRADVDAVVGSVQAPAPAIAFAVGGSATSLVSVAGGELTPDATARALRALTAEPAADAARRFGLHVERVRLLPAGLLVLEGARRAFAGAPLHIATGGLREGVVLRAMHGRS